MGDMKKNELERLLEKLLNKYEKTAQDLHVWIKHEKGISRGFSTTTISLAKTNGEGTRYRRVLNKAKEFWSFLEEGGEMDAPRLTAQQYLEKASLYYNQSFYLYFYDEGDTPRQLGITRVLLKIGADNKSIYLNNVQEGVNTDYQGEMELKASGQHLVFRMQTVSTCEKHLHMNFIICPETIPLIAVGQYCTINKKGALVAGTLIMEHCKSSEEKEDKSDEVKCLLKGTEEYSNLPNSLKQFLGKKEKNQIKVTTGIFSYSDLDRFLDEQKLKLNKKDPLPPIDGVFLSAPMHALDTKYSDFRKKLLNLIDALKEVLACSVHFAGTDKDSEKDFNYSAISFRNNIGVLDKLNYFILIYPEKLVSSVFIEVGWALKSNKHCLFFVKNRADLPYLLQDLDHPRVRIIEYQRIDDVIRMFKNNGKHLFKND